MSSKTKIVVVHMKELVYTGIFLLLGLVLLILLISMFTPKTSGNPPAPSPETKQEALLLAPPVFTSVFL